jgi:predicted TIM-barrel fold metal-dependent hydrolase
MHIVDPDKYPLAANALYRPSTHSLTDALDFESSVGLDKIVLVQPSIYGFDNSCMLEALRRLGPRRARAVVSFDPATTPVSQLRRWHDMGVRGARLNLQSTTAVMSPAKLEATLRQYAAAVKPFDWVIQVYVPMPLLDVLEPIVPTLGVRFCIDHIGHPCLDDVKRCCDPYELPGFEALVRLLEGGHTYLKMSAPYRSNVGGKSQSYVEAISRELIRLKGRSRLVFATDWPHTRFEGLDIRPWMETVLDWCNNDEVLVERLFKGNADDLWGAGNP